MNRLIAFSLALLTGSAFADPYSMVLTQRNSADTGNLTRTMTVPTSASLWFYNPTTQLPGYVTLGTGLTFSAGQLAMTSAPVNADWASSSGLSQILNKPLLATVATSGSYNDLNTKPTFATVATSGLYADLLSKPTLATVATTGAYADLTGKPTIPTVTAFDFSQPFARTLAVSTDYQASNTAKAAVLYPSLACTNSTTVLAASACTVQVRQSATALTCSTGVVLYTINLSVSLGLLITQASTNPAPVFVPIGGHVIFCPSAGTFTITAVEQSAG